MPDIALTTVKQENSVIHASAVFEGGGVRGIAHVGALTVAESLGYQWDYVAGTSAGAVVAAFVAAGYSAEEMREIMQEVDYRKFIDHPLFDLMHFSEVIRMIAKGGFYTGSYIETFMREKLQKKGIQKFSHLLVKGQEDNPDPFMRYRLTIIASDITGGRILRLPQDAVLFGQNPDDLDVARAVRMSASLPFFFVPMYLKQADGTASCIVDGGLLSNFPLFLFERPGVQPDKPTLGFRLVDPHPVGAHIQAEMFSKTNSKIGMLKALLSTMLSAHDKLYMSDSTFVRTIAIPANGISATQFDLTHEQAQMLFESGEQAAQKFFSTWNFEAYKATFGSGKPLPPRQEQLHAAMQQQATGQLSNVA
ncbi:MAG: patatin-like phospholipase family protein [Ktedonobacteraceae bacterium]|nr:patatin-like phospholipase family protein [Ktedonobacteraceae bacterium]